MKIQRPSKRTALFTIIGSILITLLIAFYGWQSFNTWKSYETRLRSEEKQLTDLKDVALNGKNATVRLKAIRALDDEVAKRSELCQVDSAYAWQAAVVPVLKDGTTKCQSAVKRLDAIATSLSELRDYLDVGAEIQGIVGGLASVESLNEKNWTEQGLNRAREAQKEISAIKANGKAVILKTQAKSSTDDLVKQWDALISANAAKDKSAFLQASLDLTAAYASFAGLADTSDDTIDSLVSKLTAAGEGV